MEKKLIVICGATAVGKSALALEIAQKLKTFIISADSRQVYIDFDIGTAKPTPQERELVPHYMIDICHPQQVLTVAEYQEQVYGIINRATSVPLLVGGTGLYIKAVTKGLKIPPVAPQPVLRAQLAKYSQRERYSFLQQLDPIACEKIHPNDETRTIRALEVYYVTGKPISQLQGESPPPYPILQIGLQCEPRRLQERIARRTREMLAKGLAHETAMLMQKYGEDLPLLNTLGYAEMKDFIQGKITLFQAEELIVLHTRQFAKRQRTWFNAYPEIKWFDVDNPHLHRDVWDTIVRFLEQ
ncbi:MAG: tRNA (adenosine(37)-N6)-dimethylallyltransferase MiaA [Geminocystis sp.]|nr:tRNA (adenosine(37)-N6)-dimethylallyltransferase MiaA [Geminocystis sp.]MCS7148324.1 tRNA (adenosine(37)-N6)-dimethylallyltransferase MiaA [Geminocystis sp.]MCX8077738.1 tRNA (adenosine(37)-N6)-dimethylallyltransferase MiaA [Geminocystis sp.]MDW8116630.1 tRNA (adenosine(37)-N6)-dimethylallyltransferase MiaA [Geminocystis sp.]HIK38112.1 tRNA (adenosine(37)-N6)-dimethylallyltransferase MiaA [Geminocystis sp. M7585_C2015_104]